MYSRREVDMKQHEREYFVSKVRSGKYYIKYKDIKLTVLTPTIDDLYFIEEKYHDTYNECLLDGIKHVTHEFFPKCQNQVLELA